MNVFALTLQVSMGDAKKFIVRGYEDCEYHGEFPRCHVFGACIGPGGPTPRVRHEALSCRSRQYTGLTLVASLLLLRCPSLLPLLCQPTWRSACDPASRAWAAPLR